MGEEDRVVVGTKVETSLSVVKNLVVIGVEIGAFVEIGWGVLFTSE